MSKGFDEREVDLAIRAVALGLEADVAFIDACKRIGVDPNSVTGSPLLAVAVPAKAINNEDGSVAIRRN